MHALRWALIGLCLSLLWSCVEEEETGPQVRLTLAPSSLFLSQFKGQTFPVRVQVNAVVEGSIEGDVQIVIADTAGIMGSSLKLQPHSNNFYTATFNTQAGLSRGQHKGALQIRVCADASCKQQYGSTSLPYDITVLDELETLQPPLAPWAGVSDWTMFKGDAAHRGHVPVRLDPARFSKRWTAPYSAGAPVSDSATGTAYLMDYGPTGSELLALKESDGSELWRSNLKASSASSPAIAGGQVYIAAVEGSASYVWAIDARTGTTTFKTPTPTDSGAPLGPAQPVVMGQTVYVNFGQVDGWIGETKALAASTGTVLWSVKSGGRSAVSPAVDGQYLYFYKPNSSHYGEGHGAGFTVLDKASGATAFTVLKPSGPPQEGQTSYRGSSPVLTVNGRALVNRNGTGFSSPLDCVDIATQKLAWEATDGKFIGTPAVANNIIYTINENRFRLEARSLDDGHLLWHWSPQAVDGSIIYGNVLVTDNLVFFSTNTHVYAVDIEKRTGVWSYPRSGELTISASGLLYIAFGGKVTAINLQ